MKSKYSLLILIVIFYHLSSFSQNFSNSFEKSDEKFKSKYENFLKKGELPLKYWEDYLVTYDKSIERYILRIFHKEESFLKSEISYKDQELKIKDGSCLYFFDGKLVSNQGQYMDNLKEDEWINFDSLGIIKSSYFFRYGILNGPFKKFFSNGEISHTGYYKEGRFVYDLQKYYENGAIKEEKTYSSGYLNGNAKYYDSSGVLLINSIFKNGNLIKFDSKKEFSKFNELEINNIFSENCSSEIFTAIELNPEFIGGETELETWLNNNINYPNEAKKNNISGRVFLNFIVETNGSITNINIVKGLGFGCDNEAIRVVKNMPNWKPGYHNGKPVRLSYYMPIVFKLD